MYKVLITGHGKFPEGVHSALNMIVGENNNVSHMQIQKNDSHDEFEEKIIEFLNKNDQVIVFADLTGGAPHQIVARAIINNKFKNHFVVSGTALSFLVQLCISLPNDKENATLMIAEYLEQSKNYAKVMKV